MPGASRLPRKPRVRRARPPSVRSLFTHQRTTRQLTAARANLSHTKGRPRSAAQIAAAHRNLLKARGHHGPMTPARRAAMLRNLAKARLARRNHPATEKEKAAARRNLMKARSRPKTAKQIAADRRNLAKARAARWGYATAGVPYTGGA